MRVWITRTQPGAGRTAARLQAVGLSSLLSPVLEVRSRPASPDLAGFEGLVFTSPNAVERFSSLNRTRSLPAFAVGHATAEALTLHGFDYVITGGGDVEALSRLIVERRPGRLLHLAALEQARDLAELCAPAGVEIEVLPIYETVVVSPDAALAADDLIAVTVHSARAARAVVDQAASRLHGLHVVALSPACAAPFRPLRVKSLAVAPFPEDASLVRLVHDTLSKARE